MDRCDPINKTDETALFSRDISALIAVLLLNTAFHFPVYLSGQDYYYINPGINSCETDLLKCPHRDFLC